MNFRFDATYGIHTAPGLDVDAAVVTVISEGSGSNVFFASYDYSKLHLPQCADITPSLSFLVGVYTTVIGRNALWENA